MVFMFCRVATRHCTTDSEPPGCLAPPPCSRSLGRFISTFALSIILLSNNRFASATRISVLHFAGKFVFSWLINWTEKPVSSILVWSKGGSMPAQSFGGGAASGGGGSAPAGAPAAGASPGGGAAPPRQQRQRARRGQATDPHSIAERVRHSPTTFPFSLHFLMPASLYSSPPALCWSSTILGRQFDLSQTSISLSLAPI